MKTKMLFSFVLLAIVFGACKKDPVVPQPEELLTNKSWIMTSMTVDPAIDWFGTGVKVSNIYAQLPSCAKDDLLLFEKNNLVKFDEGGTRCSTADPQTVTGSWTLSADKKTITVVEDGEAESWSIQTLTASDLALTFQVEDGGIAYTLSIGYHKQ